MGGPTRGVRQQHGDKEGWLRALRRGRGKKHRKRGTKDTSAGTHKQFGEVLARPKLNRRRQGELALLAVTVPPCHCHRAPPEANTHAPTPPRTRTLTHTLTHTHTRGGNSVRECELVRPGHFATPGPRDTRRAFTPVWRHHHGTHTTCVHTVHNALRQCCQGGGRHPARAQG